MQDNKRSSDAAKTWAILRADQHEKGEFDVPTLPISTNTSAGPIRIALGKSGEPRLLLPLSRPDRSPALETGSSMSIKVSSFGQRGQTSTFLDLICNSYELETVFGELVEEIITRIENGHECVDAVSTTVDDFKSLLVPGSTLQVDAPRTAGLVAELIVLNRLLELSSSAWRNWRGPTGDRHDFRSSSTSLEVKASLSASSMKAKVNGLNQLEPPSGGVLYLHHLVLEPVAGGRMSISALGRSALSRADEPSQIQKLLDSLDCNDVDNPQWNQHTFRLESETLFLVDRNFPRLVPSSFHPNSAPTGVSRISYEIDLSLAAENACNKYEHHNLLKVLSQ